MYSTRLLALKGSAVLLVSIGFFSLWFSFKSPTKNAFVAANRGDYALASELLREDAANGNLSANTTLANYYKLGLGVHKDTSKAVALYGVSAMSGDYAGMINLALMYRDGIGVEQNAELAYAWLNLAHMAKIPAAQLYMSEMLAMHQLSFHEVRGIKAKYTNLANMPTPTPIE